MSLPSLAHSGTASVFGPFLAARRSERSLGLPDSRVLFALSGDCERKGLGPGRLRDCNLLARGRFCPTESRDFAIIGPLRRETAFPKEELRNFKSAENFFAATLDQSF